MKSYVVIIACFAIIGLRAFAADASKSYTQQKLPNGLELVVIESPKVPLATVVLTFKAGAMTETPDISGLTHVWEHMFFRGNNKIPDEQSFQRRTRQLGISTNAFTSIDQVSYHITLPSVYLEEGIEFMADAIKTPLLKQSDLNAERVVVLDEYDRNASEPSFDMGRVYRQVRFGSEHHRRNPLGERVIIEKVSREQLLKIRQAVFVPSNASLFISGDVENERSKSIVEKYLSDWQDPKGWTPVKQAPLSRDIVNNELIFTHRDAQNVQISYNFVGPLVREDPDSSYAADVLAYALNHRSAKFYKKMIDSRVALAAGLSYQQEAEAGEVSVRGVALAENAKKLEQSLFQEIAEWTKPDYFSDTILQDVRHSLRTGFLRNQDEPSDFVMNISFWWAAAGLRYFDTYLERLARVTQKDLAKFAEKFLVNKAFIKVVFLNTSDASKSGFTDNSEEYFKKFSMTRTKN
jgi:zinc protease